MSFSVQIKNELIQNMPHSRHCRMAEFAAFIAMNSELSEGQLAIKSENENVIDKIALLYKKLTSKNEAGVRFNENRGMKNTWVVRFDSEDTLEISEMLKLNGGLISDKSIYTQTCCKRAFLRGAFLACGSISDPEKDYHFEFVTGTPEQSAVLIDILNDFEIEAKVIQRKKYSVVYLKDGESIVDILNIMEAHVSLMDFENVRIVKEVRNSVNRRVNCESANIDKTVKAAKRQIEDLNYLINTIGLEALGKDLKATAVLRLQYPEASLSELGEMHEKPVGKSGVNHRLQKLSDMAESLRNGKPVNEKMEE